MSEAFDGGVNVDPPLPKGFVEKENPTFNRFLSTQMPEDVGVSDIQGRTAFSSIAERPSFSETFGAAFRLENVIGSAFAQERAQSGEVDPEFDPFEPDLIEGYEDFADRFVRARNREEAETIRRNIDREQEDRQTLMRAGWGGFGAAIVAGTVDPTVLVPIAGTVKKGESLLKIGGRFAAGAGAGQVGAEAILQGTQETRTPLETGLNIGGATLLGGLLGSAGYATVRGATGKPISGFGSEEFDALAGRIEQEMIYRPDDDPQYAMERIDQAAMQNPQGVGAAAVERATLDDYALAPSMGGAELTSAMKLNPLLRLSTANSPRAREIGNQLMESGLYLSRNKDGQASPVSVEQSMIEYRGWHASAERDARKVYSEMRKAKINMSQTEFYESVGRAMRRGDQGDNEYITKAAQTYRQAVDRVKDRAIEMGLLPEDVATTTAASYFHRMWNRKVLKSRPVEFKTMTRAWAGEQMNKLLARANEIKADAERLGAKLSDEDSALVKSADELEEIRRVEGSLDQYADDVAEHVWSTLMGHDSRTLPYAITAGPRGPLKERTFTIPDLFEHRGIRAEDFLIDDAQEVTDRYMRVMSADIELSRTFGDPSLNEPIEAVRAEYKSQMDGAETEQARRKINDEMEARVKDINEVRDVLRGNYGPPTYDNAFSRGAALVRAWNYTTMLGGMTVSAIPDVANKVMTNGFSGMFRDLLVPLVTSLPKVKGASREAQTLGIAVERTLATRIASLSDIGDIYGRQSQFERFTGAVTNNFTTWTGMRIWNDVMKSADYITGSNRAVRAIMRPDKMSQTTKAWLANLGIGEAEYPRIRAMIRKHGETSGNMKLAHADQWDDAEARRIWTGALGKNANIQTVTPGAGDKLLVMNGPLGQTIGQFKSFFFGAHQRITLRAMQQGRMGQGRVLSAMAAFISLGMLVYYLKSWLSNRETSDDPAVWVREGVDRSGTIPLLMEGFNTAEKMSGQTFVGESPASRYASRNWADAIAGPSFGRLKAVGDVVRNTLDGELQDRDIHSLRKLLPYNNVFLIRKFIDDLEIAAVELTDAEETAISDRREPFLIGQ